MTKFSRLLEGCDDDLSLALLKSAEGDAPPSRALAETAAALGVSAAVGAGAGAAASGKAASLGAVSKSLASNSLLAKVLSLSSAGALLQSLPIGGATIAKHIAIGIVGGLFVLEGVQYTADLIEAPTSSALESPRPSPASPAENSRSLGLGGVQRAKQADSPKPEPAVATPPTAPGLIQRALNPAVTHAERDFGKAQPISHLQLGQPAPTDSKVVQHDFAHAAPAPETTDSKTPTARFAPVAPSQPPQSPASGSAVAGHSKTLGNVEAPSSSKAASSKAASSKGAHPNTALALEVQLLDQARAALSSGNPGTALSFLDQYREQRKSAVLLEEATVVRIQALLALGQRSLAATLARRFIERHPKSRHAESLRLLAEQAP